MAIAPISNTLTKNYNIGFTGHNNCENNKAKNNHNHRTSGSMIKAIPLATLLAMSPLTVQNSIAAEKIKNSNNIEMVDIDAIHDVQQERTIVASKEFPFVSRSRKSVRVDCVNTKGGSAKDGFDKIELVFTDRFGRVYDDGEVNDYVTEVNDYNFSIISDDGVNQGTVPLTKIIYKNPTGLGYLDMSLDAAANFIKEQIAKNPQKDVIKTKTYNRKLGPTGGAALQNNPKPVTLKQAKGIKIDMSKFEKTASPITVVGEKDKFTLRFYKNKLKDDNLVTCEAASNPGNEFRVGLIGNFSAIIEKEDPSGIYFEYPATLLNSADDTFCLMDTKLFDKLKELLQLKREAQKAYVFAAVDYEYTCTSNGIIGNTTD